MARSAAEEVEKMRILQERITAPSLWGRVPCGVRFEDLQDTRFEDAVKLIKKHYIPEEITFKSLNLIEDREGTDEYIHHIRICMKDKTSIAAVKEGINKLVGVLVMRLQEKGAKSRTFSRTKITYNPVYTTVMNFYNKLEESVNVFKELEVRRYLKIYVLALKARYRHRGIAKEMIKAAMNSAASAKVPAIVGIFTTGRLQQVADELGFSKFNELYYIKYLINDQIIFWDTGLGNYGAALMGYRIPDVEERIEMKPTTSSRFIISSMQIEDEEDGKEEENTSKRKEN